MSAAAQVQPRYRVVPLPTPPGEFDLWGVMGGIGGIGGTVTGLDGEPVAFYSFTEAARWADAHG
ncbi:hypothetical protein [Kitasatospora sp. NPDC088134]|uniref:hypothetical protein n=1 Tax=Kitasatospora sp. NPDC088134 TaxID=3364071 RepID=UPI00380D23CF